MGLPGRLMCGNVQLAHPLELWLTRARRWTIVIDEMDTCGVRLYSCGAWLDDGRCRSCRVGLRATPDRREERIHCTTVHSNTSFDTCGEQMDTYGTRLENCGMQLDSFVRAWCTAGVVGPAL